MHLCFIYPFFFYRIKVNFSLKMQSDLCTFSLSRSLSLSLSLSHSLSLYRQPFIYFCIYLFSELTLNIHKNTKFHVPRFTYFTIRLNVHCSRQTFFHLPFFHSESLNIHKRHIHMYCTLIIFHQNFCTDLGTLVSLFVFI